MARQRKRANFTVGPHKADLERCQKRADAGFIPQKAVWIAAIMWRAAIIFQETCGPGYNPLELMAEMVPPEYLQNFILKRLKLAA